MIEASRRFILVPSHGCSCKISYIFSIIENISEVLIAQSPQMFDSLRQRNWQQDCRIIAQVPDTRCSGSKLLTRGVFMSMKRCIAVLVFALTTAAIASAEVLILPGTPCIEIVGENAPCSGTVTSPTIAADPLFDLTSDPGVTDLGIFVVPGDVVLFETAGGSLTDKSTWSDVLEFSDSATGRGSIATIFPDAEGIGVILPTGFSLSANAVGLPENPVGTGTDADFTTYIAGTATYQVHSDSPCCEVPDVETPEPSSVALLGLALAGVFVLGRRKALQS